MAKDIKVSKSAILKDSFLISIIITNMIFVIIFLISFIKNGDLFLSFKISLGFSSVFLIAFGGIVYTYIDAVTHSRVSEIKQFDKSFDIQKQKQLEAKQKKLLAKVNEYSSAYESISNPGISSKSSMINAKTQFNPDFENDVDDLSNKMDL